ncbi:MAG: dynamin family protein [Aquabacterium sp.]
MTPPRLSRRMDARAEWRRGLQRRLDLFGRSLTEHDLLDADAAAQLAVLTQRLAGERLVLAFVAEFSRGKSELINAMFFGDAGRRVLPATPGRTTMCPVELAWSPAQPPSLELLPIQTRRNGVPVSQLRSHPDAWHRVALPLGDTAQLATAFAEVSRTAQVTVEDARALGFWNDQDPADNPPQGADGLVEVPAWRHALINYPHPLLRRGLVVIDTPGLNAIGAEPELTLNLLPSAHATVFLLAADAGVTRSDLAVWRDHLGDQAVERFVVLNKVDMLADPLLSAVEVAALVERQCEGVAQTLVVPRERVFPLSARQALAARLSGDADAAAGSGLPALEQALVKQLLPSRAGIVSRMVCEGTQSARDHGLRQVADRRRQNAEQLAEMRSLRGKSRGKVQMLGARLEQEAGDFERCLPRLAALRSVQVRHVQAALQRLSGARVKELVQGLQRASDASLLRLGTGRAFTAMMAELRTDVERATADAAEVDQMIGASFRQLNAEHAFALTAAPMPSLQRHRRELMHIEASYGRYFSPRQVWRLAGPGFMGQFVRMLQAKLMTVVEGAAADLDGWGRGALAQLETQLRDRRKAYQQRREAFQRIDAAAGELERGIADLHALDERLRDSAQRIETMAAEMVEDAQHWPQDNDEDHAPQLQLVRVPVEPGLAAGNA